MTISLKPSGQLPTQVYASVAAILHRISPKLKWATQESGIDARLGEIGGMIQETMESYEVEVNGTVYPGSTISVHEVPRANLC